MHNKLLITLLFNSIFITGCSREIPAHPMCRVNQSQSELAPAQAACLIKQDNKLLVLQHKDSDDWHIPQGKALKSISAQCTAHNVVWKNTGLNVEVGELLLTASDDTLYFACHLTDEHSQQIEELSVPEWANRNVAKVSFIDPFILTEEDFSESIELPKIREAFISIQQSTP
ncbi:MAG: hypothetical protein ABJJ44_15985 [Paraglaciecola sp.]|uniref:hypothetical protein n=1 Tax=Paraglaciecola sp. TaxID=1920173 RepID=UPI00329A3E73